jgi:integrase
MAKVGEKCLVRVEEYKERLRLRWTEPGGRRRVLAMGCYPGKTAEAVAGAKAKQIEGDILSGNYDPTLAKYRPAGAIDPIQKQKDALTVPRLIEKYIEFKRPDIDPSTLAKHNAALKMVQDYLDVPWGAVTEESAGAFKRMMLEEKNLKSSTVKSYLVIVRSAWNWGMKRHGVDGNPWADIKVRVDPAPPRESLSEDQTKAIVNALRSHKHYRHYADFVEFLFLTGCRFGEAAALKWENCADDCSSVWIGKSASRGKLKSTKTKPRSVNLGYLARVLLMSRRGKDSNPDNFVFPGLRGKVIENNNFRNRAWAYVRSAVAIEDHHTPYTTRHTFITHAIDSGMKPTTVATMTGNSPAVIFRHYLSDPNRTQKTPDLFFSTAESIHLTSPSPPALRDFSYPSYPVSLNSFDINSLGRVSNRATSFLQLPYRSC